jgi:ADP-heptose:LPS heptosyltransferase
MRILILTSARFADAVNSTGILEHLRLQHRQARFTIACGASSGGLFAHFPNLERLVLVDRGNRDFRRFHVWRKLVMTSWDLTIDIRGSDITKFMFAGKRKIIRGARDARQYRQLAAALNISPPPPPHIWTNAADFAEAERLLPAGGPIIGFCPTASEKRKFWPVSRYAETFRALAKSLPGARAAIFASPSDTERYICAELAAQIPGAIDLARNLAIPLLAACTTRLALFISNDTGLPHVAAAAGAPTLTLFTSARASTFAPVGPRAATLIASSQLSDTPMELLAVETVVAAASEMLPRSQARPPERPPERSEEKQSAPWRRA